MKLISFHSRFAKKSSWKSLFDTFYKSWLIFIKLKNNCANLRAKISGSSCPNADVIKVLE